VEKDFKGREIIFKKNIHPCEGKNILSMRKNCRTERRNLSNRDYNRREIRNKFMLK